MPKNRFGFWTLTFLVVANMIGAGVFTTSGFSIADLGTPHLVVLAWFVGGLIALAGAVSYGQLVRHLPESGGEYLFLSRAAHPLLGCIAGWVSLIAGFTGPIAFAATTFETYALPEAVRPAWFREDMLAGAVIIACLLWHSLRPRVGEFGQNLVVALKLLMLAVFLCVAASLTGSEKWPDKWQGAATAIIDSPPIWNVSLAFAGSLVWISLSYAGFNAAVYVADEAENPATISRALVLGTCIVVVLYILLNGVFVFAPPRELIVGNPDVAAIAADWLGGTTLAVFVRSTIAIALFTSVSSMMMAAPRVYAKMADDGVMPSWLSFADGHPRIAMTAQAFLAIVMVASSTLYQLLDYLSLTLALSAAGTVACLFLPSVRRTRLLHPIMIAPFVFVVATLVSAALLTINKPENLIGTVVTFAVGTVGYFVVRGVKSG